MERLNQRRESYKGSRFFREKHKLFNERRLREKGTEMLLVYKRYSFRSILTGERTWYPSYLRNVLKDAEHLMDFIYEDISHDGPGFNVETGAGKMVFSRDDMYGTKIMYTWKEE